MAPFLMTAWLAVAVATLSFTVTATELFRPVREWFTAGSWFHRLLTCPYCVSHWVAATLVLALWQGGSLPRYVITVFQTVGLSCVYLWVLTRAYQSRDIREVRELRELYHRIDEADAHDDEARGGEDSESAR